MNIFVLSKNIKKYAKYHSDKHVVKMILEYSQILSTLCRLSGIDVGYKQIHIRPSLCYLGRGVSKSNWLCWLKKLNYALHEEYKYRYGKDKIHKAYFVSENLPIPILPKLGMTSFAQAMPERYKNDNAVTAYRDYYLNEKHDIAFWTKRLKPYWFRSGKIADTHV